MAKRNFTDAKSLQAIADEVRKEAIEALEQAYNAGTPDEQIAAIEALREAAAKGEAVEAQRVWQDFLDKKEQ